MKKTLEADYAGVLKYLESVDCPKIGLLSHSITDKSPRGPNKTIFKKVMRQLRFERISWNQFVVPLLSAEDAKSICKELSSVISGDGSYFLFLSMDKQEFFENLYAGKSKRGKS